MPYAVTHVLIAIIIAELIRDYLAKDRKKFPLHYVLLAGFAGLLPDLDVLFVMFNHIPISSAITGRATSLHPSFTHSILWIPIVLAFAFLFLWLEKKGKMKAIEKVFSKYHSAISSMLFIIALGLTVHLALDVTLTGYLRLGFFTEPIGLNLIPFNQFGSMLLESIDGALLFLWLAHEGIRHNLSKFL